MHTEKYIRAKNLLDLAETKPSLHLLCRSKSTRAQKERFVFEE